MLPQLIPSANVKAAFHSRKSLTVYKLLKLPMALDIDSQSDFMRSLQEEWPDNSRRIVYENSDDPVARPKASSAITQYSGITARSQEVHQLTKFIHNDFVKVLAFAL